MKKDSWLLKIYYSIYNNLASISLWNSRHSWRIHRLPGKVYIGYIIKFLHCNLALLSNFIFSWWWWFSNSLMKFIYFWINLHYKLLYFYSSCNLIFFCSENPCYILCLRALISFYCLFFNWISKFLILLVRDWFHLSYYDFYNYWICFWTLWASI